MKNSSSAAEVSIIPDPSLLNVERKIPFSEFDHSVLNENFYGVEKDKLLFRKPLKERLSSGYINYNRIFDEKSYREIAVRYFTRVAFGLFEPITRERNPNIVFNLESDDSYCGLVQNILHIGMNILTLKEIPRQYKVDMIVSHILHEQYHKRYTIADIKKYNVVGLKQSEDYYASKKCKEIVEKLFPTKLQGLINNILEDRRIEQLGVEDFPGYSFFFEESRKYAAYLHSAKHFSPEYISAMIVDYLMIKILLPEMEDRFFEEIELYEYALETEVKKMEEFATKKFVEDLKEVKKIIHNIKTYIEKHESTVISLKWKDILHETNEIYKLIPQSVKEKLETALEKEKIKFIHITSDLGVDNLNKGDNREELSAEELNELTQIIADELKKMASEDSKNDDIERITESKIISKDKNEPYTIIQMIEQPVRGIDQHLLTEGTKASRNIVHNLTFLDSKYSRFIENYELSEGELDETELYSIGFGNKYIFEEIEDLPSYQLDFGLLLDESGSMRGRIQEAKLAFLSLILGLKDNPHVNVFAYGHTANSESSDFDSKSSTIQMYKYYNTIERFIDWRRIFCAKARTNNADGYAIQKMGEIMNNQSKTRDKILCVISDGQPHAYNYGGETGEKHVRQVVNDLERQGITVIQICMAYIENSPKMFKHYVQYEKDGKFFDNLKKILMTKLQQFSEQI